MMRSVILFVEKVGSGIEHHDIEKFGAFLSRYGPAEDLIIVQKVHAPRRLCVCQCHLFISFSLRGQDIRRQVAFETSEP